jgi:putative component of membrane protein insertase Oxa1/YidC/SpoIIIJ protein YidD
MNTKSSLLTNNLIFSIIFLSILLTISQPGAAQGRIKQEINRKEKQDNPEVISSGLRGDRLSESMVRFYQMNVSPKQGKKCPAYPSCSSFTLDAIKRYGFFQGFLMGLDRIYFRENFDMKYLKHYRAVQTRNGEKRVYDPVDANNIFKKKSYSIIEPAASDIH